MNKIEEEGCELKFANESHPLRPSEEDNKRRGRSSSQRSHRSVIFFNPKNSHRVKRLGRRTIYDRLGGCNEWENPLNGRADFFLPTGQLRENKRNRHPQRTAKNGPIKRNRSNGHRPKRWRPQWQRRKSADPNFCSPFAGKKKSNELFSAWKKKKKN